MFSYWLLVVGTIISMIILIRIWCLIVVGNEKELEATSELYAWLRGVFWRSSKFLVPDEWWLSGRAIREISPFRWLPTVFNRKNYPCVFRKRKKLKLRINVLSVDMTIVTFQNGRKLTFNSFFLVTPDLFAFKHFYKFK